MALFTWKLANSVSKGMICKRIKYPIDWFERSKGEGNEINIYNKKQRRRIPSNSHLSNFTTHVSGLICVADILSTHIRNCFPCLSPYTSLKIFIYSLILWSTPEGRIITPVGCCPLKNKLDTSQEVKYIWRLENEKRLCRSDLVE